MRDGRADVTPQFNAFARQMFGEALSAFQALGIEGAKSERVIRLRQLVSLAPCQPVSRSAGPVFVQPAIVNEVVCRDPGQTVRILGQQGRDRPLGDAALAQACGERVLRSIFAHASLISARIADFVFGSNEPIKLVSAVTRAAKSSPSAAMRRSKYRRGIFFCV